MNVTTILGSPRRKGNTAAILSRFEELARSDHDVNRINLPRTGINGCLGCGACQRIPDLPGCVQKDQISEILDEICRADLVVYASPVYVWDVSTQMKALLDRLCSCTKWNTEGAPRALLNGRSAMLLTTCGGKAETNVDLITEIFRREMLYLQCHVAGIHAVDNCTEPAALGARAEDTATRMVADLSTALA